MTYAEKLKDPRWQIFRQEYYWRMRDRQEPDSDPACEGCGLPPGRWELHHRVYIDGRDPWEYEDEDLLLLCPECHDRIHKLEKRVRAFIIAVPPHFLYEFEDFFDEILQSPAIPSSLAWAKNAVRD